MGARANCADDFIGLGGCKNKLHVGRWLFNNLEKRVEPLRGNHVGLVEDENLEAITSWSKNCTLSKIAGIINTVVRSGVNFHNV